ncbi:hypothetical protein [Vibrio sp. MED222]|uniref:hypothetical protein n=1 Tax=Vibrio sp. MED222 TaxID=314290 RepID=UPI000068E567|nr:hypothetical protein [Vibrio sp. MED222]EAQ54278.1 hypothetical protein MED222_14310 [Vibrio sp. MED222]
MIEDLINSTKVALYDRATSPLFGSFLASWCIWNWEIIWVLFSNIPVMNKINFMDNHFSSFLEAFGLLFLGPVLTSLAYLFVYPIPAEFVFSYTQKRQKNLKTIKIGIEEDTPLPEAEWRALRARIPELEFSFNTQLTKKDSEIEKLKSQLSQYQASEEPEEPKDATVINKQQPINVHRTTGNNNTNSVNTVVSSNDNNDEDERPINVITEFTVGDQTYRLGEDYQNSKPGSVNVIDLRNEFSFKEQILVTFTLETELKEGQYITVFDGYSTRTLETNSFEIEKIDYQEQNAFIVVRQINPFRVDAEMVVSNKVQFAY